MINYDEHCVRNIAGLLKKLKDRIKEKGDNVANLWLEQLLKFFDEGGYRYTNMIFFDEDDVRKMRLLVRGLEKKNADLHSGKLAVYIQDLEDLLDKGVKDE